MSFRIAISGSIAFDEILKYSGQFADHILSDKLDALSLSFLINSYENHFGGTAGNIAYSLGLLGASVAVVGTVGEGFESYRDHLESHGVSLQYVREIPSEKTAKSLTISDAKGSQITGFFVGAMKYSTQINLVGYSPDLIVVSPDSPQTMIDRTKWARVNDIPFVSDIGQQIIDFDKEELEILLKDAQFAIFNEYEYSVLLNTFEEQVVFQNVEKVIVTLGDKGSELRDKNGVIEHIPAIGVSKINDPTGAGDGYRAGLVYGFIRNLDIIDSMRLGTYIASKVIEHPGTQNHELNSFFDDIKELYEINLIKELI